MNWKFILSPVFGPEYTVVVTDGTSLWIDGDEFDLSTLGTGKQVTVDHERILGDIKNVGGVIHATIRFDSPKSSSDVYNFPDPLGYDHTGDGIFWIDGEPEDFVTDEVTTP